MRVLIIPLPALAKTEGSTKRVRELVEGFIDNGFTVATCAVLDGNFKPLKNIYNYYLEVPMPLGLPKFLGKRAFEFAEKSGIKKRKEVSSFEEVLNLTGAISEKYFEKNIICVRNAIKHFKPDVVYSEFNLGSIIAGKLENVKVFSDYSYPVQASYACTPNLAKGVNKVLSKLGLENVNSSLDIFLKADKLIVPSSYELEPIEGENIIFTGPFNSYKSKNIEENKSGQLEKRNKIVAYMGSGTISTKLLLKELKKAFFNTKFEVYIAVDDAQSDNIENIHIDKRFDFSKLLPDSFAFINHGGQNSIMDGLRFHVPQIICPGRVFERKYNAESITAKKAGIQISEKDFSAEKIKECITCFEENHEYINNSINIWKAIEELGGVKRVIQEII